MLLTALDRDGRRIFLFLNGPVGANVDALLARLSNVRIVRSETNIGLAAGLNAIMDTANAEGVEVILLLDQDSSPSSEMPERLAERLVALQNDDPLVSCVGPLLTTPQGSGYLPMRYDWVPGRTDNHNAEVFYLPTSGTVVSLAAWNRIGRFRDDYFIGGIDVEWGFRARNAGYVSVVAKDILMPHRWGQEAGTRSKSPQILRQDALRNYYYFRNAVHLLRLPFVPIGWRARYAIRMAAQAAILFGSAPLDTKRHRRVVSAVVAGWHGWLGPYRGDEKH